MEERALRNDRWYRITTLFGKVCAADPVVRNRINLNARSYYKLLGAVVLAIIQASILALWLGFGLSSGLGSQGCGAFRSSNLRLGFKNWI